MMIFKCDLYSLIAEGLGGFFAPLLNQRLSYRTTSSVILFGTLGAMLALSLSHSLLGLSFLFLVTLGYYLARPIVFGFIHDRVESERRATVDSLQALLFKLGTIAVGLPCGYVSTHYLIFAGFAFLAKLLLLYSIFYLSFSSRVMRSELR